MPQRPTPYPRTELPSVVPGEVVEIPRPRPERPDTTEPEAGPRVTILSLREVRPVADFGGLLEAEDVLRDALSAGLYRVMVSSPRYTRPPLDRREVRRLLASTRLARPYRIEHHQWLGEPADVLVVLARDLADASVLVGVPDWHRLAEYVIVHVSVVTEYELRRYPELVGQLRRRVDALFSGSEMPPLGHLLSDRLRTVGVVPPLLDVLAFPAREQSERNIDIFSPGVDPPGQHLLLRQWASAHDGKYQQDIGQLGLITSLAQHRRIFTTMATRSRLFLTNYDQFGHRKHAGAHREVGPRFYEAMAAGCALAGDLPISSRQFGEYVSAAAPMHFPMTADRLPAEVAAALADPAESERLGTTAREAALRYNDVAHRWREMAALAGIPLSPGIETRINHLDKLADELWS
ncbi:glycosyltransferase [Pseudonocardia acaciae]|uniref:glycosyltransferase n=1 Tax=Pseudonocardia acaciae TaxID=551276 RepID=UPI00048F4B85|nr:glycosyltransferase [Pseudonocardia acaciae]